MGEWKGYMRTERETVGMERIQGGMERIQGEWKRYNGNGQNTVYVQRVNVGGVGFVMGSRTRN